MDNRAENDGELTESDLHDVRRAAIASSGLEAAFLIDALADAGVPASSENSRLSGLTGGGFGFESIESRVPAVCLERAEKVIAEARSQAHERRVAEAFDDENITDAIEDRRGEFVILEMEDLCVLPLDEREGRLRKQLLEWIAESVPDWQIAKYLAVAGFNREQAHDFVTRVQKEEGKFLKETQQNRSFLGWLLIVSGAGLFVLSSLGVFIFSESRGISPRVFRAAGVVIAIAGLIVLVMSSQKTVSLASKSSETE